MLFRSIKNRSLTQAKRKIASDEKLCHVLVDIYHSYSNYIKYLHKLCQKMMY